jgi:hypothetical protein
MKRTVRSVKASLCVLTLALVLVCGSACSVSAQDLTWLMDQAPSISAVLLRTFEKAQPFSARVDVRVSGKDDLMPSVASGRLEFENGKMRWEARLSDVHASQLTPNARAAVLQLNGDRFVLLTRTDEKTNYLVLPGARACLDGALPGLKSSSRRKEIGEETISGHVCAKAARQLVTADGSANEVITWHPKDSKGPPLQIQISHDGEVFLFRLGEVKLGKVPVEQFEVPASLTHYSSIEDLVQSILIDKVKRRMGLQ